LAFQEIDVCIDTSGGPGFTPNKVLIGINQSGLTSTGSAATYSTALFPTDANCNINGAGSLLFNITQPTDNSILQLAVPRGGTTASNGLGLTAGQPRFKYQVYYFGTDGQGAVMPGTGAFNAFTPVLSFANTGAVVANGTRAVTITRNAAEAALTPTLGAMATVLDNTPGANQALLFTLP
jgi:hypothetical protein